MTAYIMMIRHDIHDPAKLEKYAELAPKAPIDKLKIIAAKTNRFRVLEGRDAKTAVILQFPDWDSALEWYDSPEYTEARQYRLAGGDYQAILVDGVDA